MTTLAIDIGGTKLAAALIDGELNILERREMPTPASQTPPALAAALEALVAPFTARATRFTVASTGIIQDGILTAIHPAGLSAMADCIPVAVVWPAIVAIRWQILTGLIVAAVGGAALKRSPPGAVSPRRPVTI